MRKDVKKASEHCQESSVKLSDGMSNLREQLEEMRMASMKLQQRIEEMLEQGKSQALSLPIRFRFFKKCNE